MRNGAKYSAYFHEKVQGLVIGDEAQVFQYFANTYHLHSTERPLPFSPTAAMQSILDRYTQSPFGGRENELTRIETFLRERENGYILVTGPSGFGKTALLIQFITRAEESQDVTCIYHLLSRRDNTAGEEDCLRGLCQQLVSYHKLTGALPNALGDLRALYADLLTQLPARKGERLVIVLDGLDEAENWTPGRILFPIKLARGVFVFFSARQVADRDWLAELELPCQQCDSIILGPLKEDEVVKAFRSAGDKAEEWIEDKTFVNAVVRMSGGDPFYIQCLLEDIRAGYITPVNIADQPKSLQKYLDRWWREVEKSVGELAVGDLLGYLGVARGPLPRTDLVRVDPNDALTGPTLGATLDQVRRFVVGDEKRGYVFCHPRFQEYVAGRMADKLAQYEAKLLDYCRAAWREGSTYALRHLASHLAQARQAGELYALISKDFMWAKRLRFGSHRSFAEDVEWAIRMAEQEGTDGLSRLISYSLLYATLGSLATNVTPEVLRVLAELGEVERAVDYAEMIVEPAQRAKAFQAIGGGGLLAALLHEMQTEKPKLDRAFLKRALEEAQRITDVEEKAKFLYILAPELARAGEAEASLVAAEQIDKEWPDEFHRRKLEVLARIPVELARAGKAKEALAALERVDEKYHSKSAVLGKIAVSLTEAGKIVDALEIAMAVQGDKDDENDVLKMIAWGCHVNEEALRAAVEDAIGITDAQERARALAMIAEAVKDVERRVEAEHEKYKSSVALEEKAANLIWLGRYDEALQILKEVKFVDLHRGRIVEEFIEGLLISDRFEDAIEMAGKAFCLRSSIHDKIEQWATRWAILRDLIVEGHTDEALDAIKLEPEALVMLGPQLARAGKIKEIISILEEKEKRNETAFEMKTPTLAVHLARAGMFIEAEMLAYRVLRYTEPFLFQAFIGIAGALAGTGRFRDIVPTAERLIKEAPKRCEALAQVATRLAAVNKQQGLEVLEGALLSAESIERAFSDVAEVLAAIAIELARLGKLEAAVSIADEKFGKEEPEIWAEVMAEFVYGLAATDKAQGQAAFEKLLASTRQIEDDPNLVYLHKQAMLECLVISLARRDQFEKAMTVAAEIEDGFWHKPLALAQLAGRLAPVDVERARKLLDEALEMAQKLGGAWDDRPLRGEMWSMFFPLLAETERQMLWIMLSSTLQDFMGHGIGYEEAKALIAAELLKAGWFEEAVTIAETLEQQDIRDRIRSYAAVALARLGKIEEAQTLAKGLADVSITMKAIVQRLLEEGKPDGAQEMVENLQEIDDETKAEMLTSMAWSFARRGQLQETRDTIAKIPIKWGYKPMVQLSIMLFFANADKRTDAEAIAEAIEDDTWKSFAKVLIEARAEDVGEEERFRRLMLLLEKALAMVQLVDSDMAKSWLLVNSVVGLAAAGRLREALAAVHQIWAWNSRFQTMSEIAAQLAKAGMVEDALIAFEEIKDQQIKAQAVAEIADALASVDPEQALLGIQMLLRSARVRGRRSTCKTMAQVVPLVMRLVGLEHGTELIWQTYEEILKVENWWG